MHTAITLFGGNGGQLVRMRLRALRRRRARRCAVRQQSRPQPHRACQPQRSRGFTLIETALATIIVGVGVLAIVAAQQAFHQQNAWSTRAGVGVYLANEIREMTLNLPRHDPVTGTAVWGPEANESTLQDFDDLDDFDGTDGSGSIWSAATENGPINAQRQIIPNMAGWSQIVTVTNVNPTSITDAQANASSNMVRVEVVVTYQSPNDDEPTEITRVSWVSPN